MSFETGNERQGRSQCYMCSTSIGRHVVTSVHSCRPVAVAKYITVVSKTPNISFTLNEN